MNRRGTQIPPTSVGRDHGDHQQADAAAGEPVGLTIDPRLRIADCNGLRLPLYFADAFVLGCDPAGCGRRKVEVAWGGFFAAFGFLASRFLRLRPLAKTILQFYTRRLFKMIVRRRDLRRVLVCAVGYRVSRGREVFPGAGGGVARAQQRHCADQDEKRQSY